MVLISLEDKEELKDLADIGRDVATRGKGRFYAARILISTSYLELISKSLPVKVNNQVFFVAIKHEISGARAGYTSPEMISDEKTDEQPLAGDIERADVPDPNDDFGAVTKLSPSPLYDGDCRHWQAGIGDKHENCKGSAFSKEASKEMGLTDFGPPDDSHEADLGRRPAIRIK
ncbi:hypothetical protein Ancab_025280 [Ancistrocladus abbreviatus]